MSQLEALRQSLPEFAKDLKLNLSAVLGEGLLTSHQRWGVALACAVASRHPELREAIRQEAGQHAPPEVLDDALAASALMGMNNIYYRFRHLMGKTTYEEKPARLRMNRLVKPLGSKVDFELFSLAVSAINGCGVCLQSHEKVVLEGGLSEDHVHEAVRIAAVIHGVALALEGTLQGATP